MAEKEYIERNAAIAKIKDKINEYPHNSNPYWISNDDYIVRGLREAIEIIDEYTPTANVQEVRHSKWELIDECANEGVYCSNCHKKVYRAKYANQKVKSNYCPNCGAKMDKDKK